MQLLGLYTRLPIRCQPSPRCRAVTAADTSARAAACRVLTQLNRGDDEASRTCVPGRYVAAGRGYASGELACIPSSVGASRFSASRKCSVRAATAPSGLPAAISSRMRLCSTAMADASSRRR